MYFDEELTNKIVNEIVNKQDVANRELLILIAKKIKEIGYLSDKEIFQLKRMFETGSDVDEIKQYIAKVADMNIKEVEQRIWESAEEAYNQAEPFYEATDTKFIPFKDNQQMQQITNGLANRIIQQYGTIIAGQAFMLDGKAVGISSIYQSILDKAVQALAFGMDDYNSIMKKALEEMASNGIFSVIYNDETGKTIKRRTDSALRQHLFEGLQDVYEQISTENGKQFGADGVELTVHSHPAPDHAQVQGHIFTLEEYEKMQSNESCKDVEGRSYSAFKRPIGKWNCRHFTYPVLIGISVPNYTDEQLQDILDKNEKGYTTKDGKHLTMYECTQVQRKLELQARKIRDIMDTMKAFGDKEAYKERESKYNQVWRMYKTFSKECGLKIQPTRIELDYYE